MKVALFSPASTTPCSPAPAGPRSCAGLGVDAEFPIAQTCCGQMHVTSGYVPEAIPVVRTFVGAFAGYDAVVTPSGSCAASIRHQHQIVAARSGGQGLVQAVQVTARSDC